MMNWDFLTVKHFFIPVLLLLSIGKQGFGQVEMTQLEYDTVMEVDVSYIEDYKTSEQPYNGHYRHHDVTFRKTRESIQFRAGEWVLPTRQETDAAFSANPEQQLRYIYEHSPWSEPTYMRYPVYSLLR